MREAPSDPTRVLVVLGTRPEAIKLAPVVRALRARPGLDVRLCATGQHADLVRGALAPFDIDVDDALDVMQPGQSLARLGARLLEALDALVAERRPDWIVVQGDTATTFAAALVGFLRDVRVAHVEAGLRSGTRREPFPEELYRRVTDLVADLYLAPTPAAAAALDAEGVRADRIHVTGNTGIDALRHVLRQRGDALPDLFAELPPDAKWILVTAHRRENAGARLEQICAAVREIAQRHAPGVHVVWPVHPNPDVASIVTDRLGDVPNVTLLPPLDYADAAVLLSRSTLVLTDSGGLQEEAPSLGVPVLVLRDVTERAEAVDAGCATLVGTEPTAILKEAERLLTDEHAYARMARPSTVFGDGRAAERVVDHLLAHESRKRTEGTR